MNHIVSWKPEPQKTVKKTSWLQTNYSNPPRRAIFGIPLKLISLQTNPLSQDWQISNKNKTWEKKRMNWPASNCRCLELEISLERPSQSPVQKLFKFQETSSNRGDWKIEKIEVKTERDWRKPGLRVLGNEKREKARALKVLGGRNKVPFERESKENPNRP